MVYESLNINPLKPAITLFAPFAKRLAVYPSFSIAFPFVNNYFLPYIESKNNSVYVRPFE